MKSETRERVKELAKRCPYCGSIPDFHDGFFGCENKHIRQSVQKDETVDETIKRWNEGSVPFLEEKIAFDALVKGARGRRKGKLGQKERRLMKEAWNEGKRFQHFKRPLL